jgi:hypothetical protein
MPKCKCGHEEVDHVVDHEFSFVKAFRPCFECECLDYREEKRNA